MSCKDGIDTLTAIITVVLLFKSALFICVIFWAGILRNMHDIKERP